MTFNPIRIMKCSTMLAYLCFLFIACDDDSDPATTETAGEVAGEVAGEAAGESAGDIAGESAGDIAGESAGDIAGETAGETAPPFDGTAYTGMWDLKIRLVDVGNIEVDFQADIIASERSIDSVELRVSKGGELSDVVATVNDIEIENSGDFSLTIDEATIPGMYSPTGSDVIVSFTLAATQGGSANQLCGDVTGEVVTLSLPISMSTFGAVVSGGDNPVPGSCDDGAGPMMFPRLEICPEISAGMNMISSGGYERSLEVILPSNYTDEEMWPLITLWHGFGSSPEDIKEYSDLSSLAESEGFILVVPSSYPDGAVEWDSLADTDSPDLAFYDDMIKCLGESFSVDPNRIHSTGLSAGGLWTAYLSVFRSLTIASAVGMSSGLIPDYPEGTTTIPYLASWGGDNDIAYDQNFDTLAQDLIAKFSANGHFVMSCNHGLEHVWETEFSPWVVRFLLDHPKDLGEFPYQQGLPEGVYPDYCEIVSAE